MKRRLPPTHTHLQSPSSVAKCRQPTTNLGLLSIAAVSSLSVAMEPAIFLSLSPELRDALAKVAMFVLVQALVYLILRSSSDVFSKEGRLRSLSSFRPMRSMSVRRVLAPLSDVPVRTDEPPSASPAAFSTAPSRPKASHED